MSFQLSTLDRIWNRAAAFRETDQLSPGDRALSHMLLAHGLAMNGGVLHALEALSPEELEQARKGYEYFGLSEVAALFMAADAASSNDELDLRSDELEQELDERYSRLVPSDATLIAAFNSNFKSNPSEFAPL